MIFPPSAISSLVNLSAPEQQFSLRAVDGAPLGFISTDYLLALIRAEMVSAIGTRSKIKHFQLMDTVSKVDEAVGASARIRQRSPGDMLRALVSGRATIYRQRLAVVQADGKTRCCVIFQHKRSGVR